MSKRKTNTSGLYQANKQEFHRELINTLMYPIILAVLILIFLNFNLIAEGFETLFWVWFAITMLAGLIALIVSYLLISRRNSITRRGRGRRR